MLTDFSWLKHLRFYLTDGALVAKQLAAELPYGYEFVGPCTKLVQTPLTDRCWVSIAQALHLRLGAQIIGPAGSGKTETVKDYARQLGKYCLVFNCQQALSAHLMMRIFMGIA
jgi:dynein heavy chain